VWNEKSEVEGLRRNNILENEARVKMFCVLSCLLHKRQDYASSESSVSVHIEREKTYVLVPNKMVFKLPDE